MIHPTQRWFSPTTFLSSRQACAQQEHISSPVSHTFWTKANPTLVRPPHLIMAVTWTLQWWMDLLYHLEQVPFVSVKAECPNHPSRYHARGVSLVGEGSALWEGVLHDNTDMTPWGGPLCHTQFRVGSASGGPVVQGGGGGGGGSSTTMTTRTWLH